MVSRVKRSTREMKHMFSMFCLIARCAVRSSPKVSMMIPKMMFSRMMMISTQKRKE